MFERFTDRARKVLMLANQEAIQFNHERVDTEHILLGLIKEGSGIAASVLKNFNLDLYRLRSEVLKLVKEGPEQVIMGKLPLTPRSKKVIEHAIEEAKALQHNYVGTEHVLLGLLRSEEGPAYEVLKGLGVEAQTVREEIILLLGSPIEKQANAVEPAVLQTLWEHRLYLLRNNESIPEVELSDEDKKQLQQEWHSIQFGSTTGGIIVLPPQYRVISASHVASQEGNLLSSTYKMQKITKPPTEIDYAEQFLTDSEILQAVARAYCHPKNSSKVLDPDLLMAATEEIVKLLCSERKVAPASEINRTMGTRDCLDILQKKVDYCKENHQEMIACVLLQVMREIEGKPVS